MGGRVRPRVTADLPACVEALQVVHEASGYPTRWPADATAWITPDGLLAAWVAELDDAIAGQVGLLAGTSEPGLAAAVGLSAARVALVTRLSVVPAARGHGLARSLIAAVVHEAAGRGLRLGLDVIETSAAAIALYESLGWTFVGREQARWQTQDGRHPMIRYYLAPD